MLKLSPKAKIIKNLLAFYVPFLLMFAASNCISSVQAVLYQDDGLGIVSQIVIFAAQLIFSITVPQIIAEAIGFKWTMAVAEIGFCLFMAANFFPKWYTLMPASIISGISQSLAWTLLGMYTALLSSQYARLVNSTFNEIQTIFLSVFTSIFLLSYVLGSILVTTILKTPEASENGNQTYFDYKQYCGANNCPSFILPQSSSKPSVESVYGLCAALIALCILAFLITVLFMDNNLTSSSSLQTISPKSDIEKAVVQDLSAIKKPKITFKHILKCVKKEFENLWQISKSIDLFLLLPITAYSGFEVTILWTEFNRSFVSCIFNVKYIGWTNIVYGLCGSVISLILGILTKYIAQSPFIVFMLMVSVSNGIYMLSMTPNPGNSYVIYLMALAFATSISYSNGQVRGLFSIHLTDNPSVFSAATIFQTFGFLIGFIISLVACTNIKLYVYIGLCALSIICYLALLGLQRYRELEHDARNSQATSDNVSTIESKISKDELSTTSSDHSTPLKEFNKEKSHEHFDTVEF